MDVKGQAWEDGADSWPHYQSKYHDDMKLIWKKFSQQGYVTMASDDTLASIFHLASNGFRNKPTDHYYRCVVSLMSEAGPVEGGSECYQNRPVWKIFFNYFR